ncbi:MAG: hypothetical protein V4699_03555 [Patescibacteria group bacterium]
MNKLIWIFLIGLIIAGAYFFVTKDNSNSDKTSSSDANEIPQPPKLPE